MVDYKSNVLLGTISCLDDSTPNLESRIQMHRKQLDYFEGMSERMQSEHGVGPLPYFRIEQGWSKSRSLELSTVLPIHSVCENKPISPGKARNRLLSILYDSNADWLICTDDDHILYDHYNAHELFWELGYSKMKKCAENRYLILPVPSYWEGYKDAVYSWGRYEIAWMFKKTRIWGYLPFCAIPNLVKYGYQPIWFHEGMPGAIESVPEDLAFTFDWVVAGGRVLQCWMWGARSCGRMQDSSIFKTEKHRIDAITHIHKKWAPEYLKTKYPRNPALWSEESFKRRKNPTLNLEIQRYWNYTSVPDDLPLTAQEKARHKRRT